MTRGGVAGSKTLPAEYQDLFAPLRQALLPEFHALARWKELRHLS